MNDVVGKFMSVLLQFVTLLLSPLGLMFVLGGCINQNEGHMSIGFKTSLDFDHHGSRTTGSSDDNVAKLTVDKSALELIFGELLQEEKEKEAMGGASKPTASSTPASGTTVPPAGTTPPTQPSSLPSSAAKPGG